GCDTVGTTTTASTPETAKKVDITKTATAARAPKKVGIPEDPKVKAFKEEMTAFMEKAWSLANLIDLLPNVAEYRTKLAAINDSFRRIPNGPTNELATLKDITKNIVVWFKRKDDLLISLCDLVGSEIKGYLTALEQALGI